MYYICTYVRIVGHSEMHDDQHTCIRIYTQLVVVLTGLDCLVAELLSESAELHCAPVTL